MPHQIGQAHKIPFYGVATGLTILDFTLAIFSVDGVSVSAAVQNSLEVTEFSSSGYYTASYVPDTAGFHILLMRNAANSVTVADGIDIEQGSIAVNLTQNTGGVDALKPVGDNLDEFLLLVFDSSDWQVGRTDSQYAQASTQLDADGNWLATPLVIQPGTYHIVVMDNFGTQIVIKPNLQV